MVSFPKMNTSFVALQIEASADASDYQSEYPESMEKKIIVVLIVTRSRPLSDGLDALLKAIPQIDEVRIARNFDNACQQIRTSSANLVLIDFVLLGNDPAAALEKIRTISPETRRVLLVDDVQEVNLMPRFAEAILIKGAAPSAVATIVTNLLLEKGEGYEHNDSNGQQDQSL